ncbi:hypothetical protein INT47_002637 [Mucor saturninus]|uniref:Uncharacterized protein n=1 Tax=Mucor saturninus TaxID=64648 RepID=A0A8H7V6C8_9FUNG|nr:hypothetical protein INT47_002637 [Mucor saturninus]
MVHLQDNPFHADSVTSPNAKTSYQRRRFYKLSIRVALICVLSTVCYFVGRSVHWDSFSEVYGFDPRDVDFVQYFCNQPFNLASDNAYEQLQEEVEPIEPIAIEHARTRYLRPETPADTFIPKGVWDNLPVKGAYYMVVRNEKLQDARSVIKSMEDHMINGTRYPWVILNNQHFTKEFRTYIKKVTTAPVFFGKIDLEAWEYPHWIDVPQAEYLMLNQEMNMDVEYTWRVEPGADYSCEMNDDKFLKMKEDKKKLGFVLTMREASASIPTLWTRVNEFRELYPQHILPPNTTIYPWIYDMEEDYYNFCHFWSNFQLADLSFFRSEAYQKYFEYLDSTGNFFYERWSDAPVQTIAAALFLKKEEIQFFNEIGYTHSIATHCPYSESLLRKCSCDVTTNYGKYLCIYFYFYQDSCTKDLLRLIDPQTVVAMTKFVKAKKIEVPSRIESPP